ncbi:hypothetical protein CBR_g49431 [Chara braunii]|uniref:C2H2-type domain-containing protein n=1 Tax=Chara braunii TaxID=69332 RepID=A0A388M596_CHABU|nr:hypothetical protein CBR_g49431 [Chara braunii]|eukprot:GBG89642.1 hypothetical protein CBR_g49431 [Chara braunii]
MMASSAVLQKSWSSGAIFEAMVMMKSVSAGHCRLLGCGTLTRQPSKLAKAGYFRHHGQVLTDFVKPRGSIPSRRWFSPCPCTSSSSSPLFSLFHAVPLSRVLQSYPGWLLHSARDWPTPLQVHRRAAAAAAGGGGGGRGRGESRDYQSGSKHDKEHQYEDRGGPVRKPPPSPRVRQQAPQQTVRGGAWQQRTPPWVTADGRELPRGAAEDENGYGDPFSVDEDEHLVLRPTVGIYWDLDNKPPQFIDPRVAASRLRECVAGLGDVVEYLAFANRHAFEYVPTWVREERKAMRELSRAEKMGAVPVAGEPYVCGMCGRKCRTHADLRKHFKQLHEREQKKRLNTINAQRGKKRKKKAELLAAKNSRYVEAARGIVLPKRGYGLMPDLKRSGVGVQLVKQGPEAADMEITKAVMKALERRIDWICLVSDDRGFEDLLRDARSRLCKTVVIGDSVGLKRAADLSLSWMDVQAGNCVGSAGGQAAENRAMAEAWKRRNSEALVEIHGKDVDFWNGWGDEDDVAERRIPREMSSRSQQQWSRRAPGASAFASRRIFTIDDDETDDEEGEEEHLEDGDDDEEDDDDDGLYEPDWDAGNLRWNRPDRDRMADHIRRYRYSE